MRRLFAWSLLVLPALAPAPAAAQAFFNGTGCDGLERCRTAGAACDAGARPISIVGGCFCLPGAAGDVDLPTVCCTGGTSTCPAGTSCTLFSDSSGGLCLGPMVDYCNTGPTSVSLGSNAVPCHTSPDGNVTVTWAAGDCDDDGVPNAVEALDPLRDPCEPDDHGACVEAGMSPAACCMLTDEPFACCADSGDPVACCAGNPLYSECCLAAEAADRVSLLQCCVGSPSVPPTDCCSHTGGLTGAECCEALGGPPGLCCEVGILPVAACMPPDAGVPVDTDAGTAADAGGPVEPPMDAGPEPLPPDTLSFGGGGGCVCSASAPRTPSALAMLVVLGIAIPAVVRRR